MTTLILGFAVLGFILSILETVDFIKNLREEIGRKKTEDEEKWIYHPNPNKDETL